MVLHDGSGIPKDRVVFAIAIDEYVTEGSVCEDEVLDPRKIVKPEVETIKLEVSNSIGPVDHHGVGFDVANAFVSKKAVYVIVACGTGISITIAANLINDVRCVLRYEEEASRLARLHYVSNVLALGTGSVGFDVANAVVSKKAVYVIVA
uniref:Sugar phosphate isomerase ywlF n=1 Tax=Eufriesea mexicana TaxID=516756 RepID=A0A310SGB2_9HYME